MSQNFLKIPFSFEERIKNLYLRNKIIRLFTKAEFSKLITFQIGYSIQEVKFWQLMA